MRLLHAGVDTAVIALWLDHENVDTTSIYLHADLELKQKPWTEPPRPRQHSDDTNHLISSSRSSSRGEQWIKGAISGHTQHVHSVRLDCDGDTVLLQVDQVGGACHTGDHSCFDADVLLDPAD